jgi:hypothetical protein
MKVGRAFLMWPCVSPKRTQFSRDRLIEKQRRKISKPYRQQSFEIVGAGLLKMGCSKLDFSIQIVRFCEPIFC